MAYTFIGIISRTTIPEDWQARGIVTRALPEPYTGYISTLNYAKSTDACPSQYPSWMQELSHHADKPLLYLEYTTWAGAIDYVKGAIWHNGIIIFAHEGETLNDFLQIMQEFGFVLPDEGFFAPFARGFFLAHNATP